MRDGEFTLVVEMRNTFDTTDWCDDSDRHAAASKSTVHGM